MERSGHAQNVAIDAGRIDRNKLVEIKIPFKAPYYSSSPGYERFYGEVNIEGNFYTYVERMVTNDTIFLLCLPDTEKTKLQKAKTSLTVDGLSLLEKGDHKNQKSLSKKPSADYEAFHFRQPEYRRVHAVETINHLYTSSLAIGVEMPLIKPPGC
jgi:hypothetical protein